MAGRPPTGATFDVERIGRRRSTGSIAALAWVGILAAFVGIALVGRTGDGTAIATPDLSPAATGSTADIAGLVPAPGDPVLLHDPALLGSATATPPIHLDSPPLGSRALVTPTLTVSGTVNVRADHVEVALQGRNEHTVAQVFVDISAAWEDLRPDVTPSFRVAFDLRAPRRVGTMWVEVTVFDAANRVLAYDRRSFVVGPIKGA